MVWCVLHLSSQANTVTPGLINPAPPSLCYQPSSLAFFIPLLYASANLCSFIFRGDDPYGLCFPQIPTMLIFFSLWGIPYLICSGPRIWRGGEGISLFSFDLFSWSLWQLMVITRWNILRNLVFRVEDSMTHAEELHLRWIYNSCLGICYFFHSFCSLNKIIWK